MVEQLVYTRLSTTTALTDLVGENIYPTTPTTNTQLPFVVYSRSASAPQLHTTGASNLTQHTIEIAVHAVDLSTVTAILSAVKAALHAYRGGQIQGSFLQTQACQEEEYGHYGLATYSVWETTANVVATADSTGVISTGPDRVTLAACDHTLTLDCDGLTLDGEAVGAAPDLSGYAVLSGGNTFSGNQSITGALSVNDTATGFPTVADFRSGAGANGTFVRVAVGGVENRGLTLFGGSAGFSSGIQSIGNQGLDVGGDGIRFINPLSSFVCGSFASGGGFSLYTPSANAVPVTVKAASAQTANLQEWQDSTSAVVASVLPSGVVQAPGVLLDSTSGLTVSTYGTDTVRLGTTAGFYGANLACNQVIAYSGTQGVYSNGDLECAAGKGLVIRSPDSTRWRITVANDGTLSAVAA